MDPMGKALVLSLGGGTPKAKAEGAAESMEGEASDHEVMASELLDAIKAGDASGVADILKSFVKTCSYEHEEEM